ncbi:diguanylate cyclase domain-containing protein [Marinomonas sp. IMCC 4694]|uniref:diguanylate cyclase domain-containing protein n=1 Tax=Marinomonas sp. IMCC 4694 TaxID=2605432 RepID=UPI0011E635FC|nr:diguanylate cyclase [Marinomonas sp. IMCC 4694]TYL47556.1 diguanylate cyclase [Marinomonas sp. IMCC 4694]
MQTDSNEGLNEVATLDLFHVGLVVTDLECNIVSANDFACNMLALSPLQVNEMNLNDLMTKPSKIMYESYIIPMLLKNALCDEVQVTLLDSHHVRKEVLVSVRLDEADKLCYWSLVSLEKRKAHISALLMRNKENEAIICRLKNEQQRDKLTGLYERQYFIDNLLSMAEKHKYNRKRVRFFMCKLLCIKALGPKSFNEEDAILIQASQILQEFSHTVENFSRLSGSAFIGCYLLSDTKAGDEMEAELIHHLTELDQDALFASYTTTTNELGDMEAIVRLLRHSLHKADT